MYNLISISLNKDVIFTYYVVCMYVCIYIYLWLLIICVYICWHLYLFWSRNVDTLVAYRNKSYVMLVFSHAPFVLGFCVSFPDFFPEDITLRRTYMHTYTYTYSHLLATGNNTDLTEREIRSQLDAWTEMKQLFTILNVHLKFLPRIPYTWW